jgi:predicted TIM-barrel fold metal-dependent hydrolase
LHQGRSPCRRYTNSYLPLTRRGFFAPVLPSLLAAQASPPLDFSTLPNFCSHEHWGSIPSIGYGPEGFRADVEPGALPRSRTGLLDLVLDPYFGGWLGAAGVNLEELKAGAKAPWDTFEKLRPALRRQQFTGVVQCVRRGVMMLHGADLLALDRGGFEKLDSVIDARYRALFAWYRTAMRRAHFSDLIRPMQPEFYAPRELSAAAKEELAFTRTVLRIDPFLDLWRTESPRRIKLGAIAGVEPADAATWRKFLARYFELAAASGAVGTKQLQAYRRPLEFAPREDSEVRFRGDLSAAEARVFQDWVVHECSKLAHDRGWVHQVHVGTNNITESSPMPLQALARRYPRMNIVMIHCWPFLNESGWLAKFVPNIYIDTCWQPVLNPQFFHDAINLWWNYVPTHKITCGHDSTSVEMAAGSSLFTREILAQVLAERTRGSGVSRTDVTAAAAALLHGNAVALYGPPLSARGR